MLKEGPISSELITPNDDTENPNTNEEQKPAEENEDEAYQKDNTRGKKIYELLNNFFHHKNALNQNLEKKRQYFFEETENQYYENAMNLFAMPPEGTDEKYKPFFKNRSKENIKFLGERYPELIPIYKSILETSPFLNCVAVEDSEAFDDCFYTVAFKDNEARPAVKINPKPLEVRVDSPDYASKLPGYSMIAVNIGLKPNAMFEHPEIDRVFSISHEFGHAEEFLKNIKDVIMDGFDFNQEEFEALKQHSNLGKVAGNLNNTYGQHSRADFFDTTRLNDDSPDRIFDKAAYTQNAYRDNIEERYADNFAINILYNSDASKDIFCPFGEHDPNKTELMLGGQYEVLRGQEVFTGLRTGAGVNMVYADKEALNDSNPSKIKSLDGFLTAPIALGGKIKLNKDGDITEENEVFESSDAAIENIYCHPRLIDDKETEGRKVIEITYELALSDGGAVLISRNGLEPEMKPCSATDVEEALKAEGHPFVGLFPVKSENRKGLINMNNEPRFGHLFITDPQTNTFSLVRQYGAQQIDFNNQNQFYRKGGSYYVKTTKEDGDSETYRLYKSKDLDAVK